MKKLCGEDLAIFEGEMDTSPLYTHALLGLYSATAARYNLNKERPLDRSQSAIIRFTRKNMDIVDSLTFHDLRATRTLDELAKAYNKAPKKNRPKLAMEEIDFTKPGNVGAFLLKGFSNSRNIILENTACVQSTSSWITLILKCIATGKPQLIEEVLTEELEANDLSAMHVMKKAWPKLDKN